MAYETGTYASPTDLLQKFAAFCLANGWTQDYNAAFGLGWMFIAHRSGTYISMRATMNETPNGGGGYARSTAGTNGGYAILLSMGTGYNSGGTYWKWKLTGAPYGSDDQPAGATYGCVGMSAPALGSGAGVSYDFFSLENGDHIFMVAEKTAGVFTWLGFGLNMIKYGAWAGGKYIVGARGPYYWNRDVAAYPTSAGFGVTAQPPCAPNSTEPMGYFTCDADGSERWFTISGAYMDGTTPNATYGYTGNVASGESYDINYDDYNADRYIPNSKLLYLASGPVSLGLQFLGPVVLHVRRGATATASPVGELPYCFYTRGANVSARGSIAYGGDTYMFFPKFAIKKEV